MTIQAVLFDLDGTLLDTAPDLLFAINQLRQSYDLPALPLASIRPIVSHGTKAMLKVALNIDETHADFKHIRTRFLDLYHDNLAQLTRFFPHIETVLTHLEKNHLPWGIVTNKPTKHTLVLLKALEIDKRSLCIICGDSLPTNKPDPAPLLEGCKLLKQNPNNCLYVGDCITDVIASKAAGMPSLVALYGYINAEDDPRSWQADGYVEQPLDIIEWLIKQPLNRVRE